jgi:predicted benzoate:H+ symporter BenE
MGINLQSAITSLITCVATMALLWGADSDSNARDRALAESLANESTRQHAITSLVASGSSKVPILLAWTTTPPKGVLLCSLYDGLADAFGEMKTKEAVPFLIKNIGIYRSCGVSLSPWLKAPALIEWNLPAVGALVKVGPDASRALIAAFPNMTEEDRVAAVFVVSQIKGVPEARPFLESMLGHANRESYWAEEGIKLLYAVPPPQR